ncbi:MAG TPA: DUF2344 domain-containing protein [Candidatus Pullilachnospira intestinigallinarum]|nr:DUF2344 domain-containing protein [Candidatus Pullilachnospira intestinigallinarum]
MKEVSVLKVRVKFSKEGAVKFIGHLDVMRYFQKAIRRAGIDVAYSEGFSPHMIMSFAAPLGVGVTSTGEYFDMELKSAVSSRQMEDAFNAQMAEGIRVLSVREIPQGKAHAAMSLVAAADYLVSFREGKAPAAGWQDRVRQFLDQKEIVILRKTKRSEKETDIRPWIYQMEVRQDAIFLQLAAGSVHNLKPELVLEAFAAFLGEELAPFALMVHRLETYANVGSEEERRLVPLEDLGKEIK